MSALPEGWEIKYGSPSFSGGLSITSSTSYVGYNIGTNIKKLTLENNGYRTSTAWAGWDCYGISNFSDVSGDEAIKSFYHQQSFNSNSSYGYGLVRRTSTSNTDSIINLTAGISTGDYNNKIEINFDTGYVKISSTGPTAYEYDTTLTTEVLNDIKTYGWVYIRLGPANSSTAKLYNTSITIEY